MTETATETASTVAQTIADQIGRRAFVMIGAKNILDCNGRLSFQIMKNRMSVTHVIVRLDADDTYSIEFGWYRGTQRKVRSTAEGIYADQLRAAIESGTGLVLSL